MFPFIYTRTLLPAYVKKRDILKYLTQQRKLIGVILIALSAVGYMFVFYIFPKLTSLYKDLDQSIPQITMFGWVGIALISTMMLIFGIYTMTKEVDTKLVEKELKKYKENELVDVKDFINFRNIYVLVFICAIFIAFSVITLIAPIYSLIGSL